MPSVFRVEIPASKSILNRALLVKSFFPELEIDGDSNCDDVKNMKRAIVSMIRKSDIDCGDAGTVLRFMGLRVSREKGNFKLIGSPGLMRRPHQELIYILEQLSVKCLIMPDHIVMNSQGWKKPLIPLRIHRETSSQFATGLILSAWDLDFDLHFEMKAGVSESYLEMTFQIALALGMEIERKNNFFKISAGQKIKASEIIAEPDYSSAFAIAAAGALVGETIITNPTRSSLQPDFKFIEILKKMGVEVMHTENQIRIIAPENILTVDVNLDSTPDLFPCLAVLCAFAKGESVLRGASHLAFKESDRLKKTAELLDKAGIVTSTKEGAFHIMGKGAKLKATNFSFDPDHDHRMAFAAGLFKLKGFEIQISTPHVVNKSFPDFWQVLGIKT